MIDEKKDMNLTLWQFLEQGILADHNRHDALVYFGRHYYHHLLT